MRIAYVTPYYNPAISSLPEMIERFPLTRELPLEMRRRGHQVRVLALGPRDASSVRDYVRYDWVRPPPLLRKPAEWLHRWKPHEGPTYYQPSHRLLARLRKLRPDVVHIFGLTLDLHLALLVPALSRHARVYVHYHGGLPARRGMRHWVERIALRNVEAALFTTPEQAQPWLEAGLLEPRQVRQIIETSSPFTRLPREEARARTGMTGDPVYLSAGRLHPIKDPLTMLRGFATIAEGQPDARLYLHYLTGEMFDDAQAFVASVPGLVDRVEFRGRADAGDMEAIYSSADFLLQASLREWSGLAVLEAMSCGCIPVVSRIPSFTAMTGDGQFGLHFTPGDAAELAAAALGVTGHDALSERIRGHFQAELSFAAMARKLEALYLCSSPDA